MKNSREKAEEFFTIIAKNKKKLVDIPLNFSQGEQGMLLYLTFVKDELTASELSDGLGVSLPRIMSMLTSLESKNMVKKSSDESDKRKTIISITEKGRKMVENSKEKAIDKITKIIDKMDEKDIDEYIRIARKIGEILDNSNF